MRFFILVMALLTQSAMAQTIKGIVKDKDTQVPLSGVTILVANSSIGTITDSEGRFALEGAAGNTTRLRISSIGYTTLERIVKTGDQELQVELPTAAIMLNNEVTITAQRSERLAFEVAASTTVVSAAQLEQQAPRSTPEALMSETGIWVQKTNHGGGSPIIRGLVGNQILMLVDGIRLNNATYRYGPNQYLSTIDPEMIERIEATRGSGSVLYGSDALGGVVQIVSKTPSFRSNGFQAGGTATAKWISAGMEQSARGAIELGGKKIAFLGGFSSRNFGNIVAGGDLGTLSPSGYQERAGDAKVVLRMGAYAIATAAFQQVTQHNVSRYDQVAQGGYSLYSFEPQERQLSYVRWETSTNSPWLKSVRVTGSLNKSIEGTLSQKVNAVEIKKQRDEVTTTGFITEFISNPTPHWNGQSGIEYYFDKVKSESILFNTISASQKAERGSYADGSSSSNLAFFTNHQVDWKRFQLAGGTRYNLVTVSVIDNVFGNQKISPNALVANAGLSYKVHPSLRANVAINTGFRAPNVDDMSKFGTVESGVFEIPSAGLSPERSSTIESGLKFNTRKLAWTITAYQTTLTDLIDRVGASYNGSDMAEGRKVYQKQNVGEAVVKGLEADAEVAVSRFFNVFGNYTYTHGENITKQEPMRRIPPMFGKVGFRFTHPTSIWVKAEWVLAANQDRLAAGDKSDARIKIRLVDNVMPGWDIINLYAGYNYKSFSLRVSAQNILNKAYRVYASGVDGYGSSLSASVSCKY